MNSKLAIFALIICICSWIPAEAAQHSLRSVLSKELRTGHLENATDHRPLGHVEIDGKLPDLKGWFIDEQTGAGMPDRGDHRTPPRCNLHFEHYERRYGTAMRDPSNYNFVGAISCLPSGTNWRTNGCMSWWQGQVDAGNEEADLYQRLIDRCRESPEAMPFNRAVWDFPRCPNQNYCGLLGIGSTCRGDNVPCPGAGKWNIFGPHGCEHCRQMSKYAPNIDWRCCSDTTRGCGAGQTPHCVDENRDAYPCYCGDHLMIGSGAVASAWGCGDWRGNIYIHNNNFVPWDLSFPNSPACVGINHSTARFV